MRKRTLDDKINKFVERLKQWVANPKSEPEIEEWYQKEYPQLLSKSEHEHQEKNVNKAFLNPPENVKETDDNNLNPVEILLLHYVNGMSEKNIRFPSYFKYRYDVDPYKLLEQLLNKGLLTLQWNPVKNMKTNKVDELKEILKKKSLKTTGKKEELIKRIMENFSSDELKTLFPERTYEPTEIGLQILNENDHIWFFHSQSHVDVSIYEAHKEKTASPHLSKFEIGYKILNSKADSYFKENNFGLYRNALLGISILQHIEGNKKDALCNLFIICYVDLSGTGNNFNKLFLESFEEFFFPYEESICKLAPGIISRIDELKSELNLTIKEMKELYFQAISPIELPFHLFTREETFQILIDELNGNKEALKKIYNKAKRRYKRQIKSNS